MIEHTDKIRIVQKKSKNIGQTTFNMKHQSQYVPLSIIFSNPALDFYKIKKTSDF